MRLPISVTQDRHEVGPEAPVVVGSEEPAQRGPEAQGREVGPGRVHPIPRHRLVPIREADPEDTVGGETREHGLLPLEVPEHGIAEDRIAVSRLAARLRPRLRTGGLEVH